MIQPTVLRHTEPLKQVVKCALQILGNFFCHLLAGSSFNSGKNQYSVTCLQYVSYSILKMEFEHSTSYTFFQFFFFKTTLVNSLIISRGAFVFSTLKLFSLSTVVMFHNLLWFSSPATCNICVHSFCFPVVRGQLHRLQMKYVAITQTTSATPTAIMRET